MCGIIGRFGHQVRADMVEAMVRAQRHRGPDAEGVYIDPSGAAGLGHNRLSIIDLSAAGNQPMSSHDGSLHIVFNGEIYNYPELRAELSDYPYRSQSDTEVLLAAYEKWGEGCLDRLIGMFALLIWDSRRQRLFAARDRFGVKPLFYHLSAAGDLLMASEIKSIIAAGVPAEPDDTTWAAYFTNGAYDVSENTFWKAIRGLPAGHCLTWQHGEVTIREWYNLAARVGEAYDRRSTPEVIEEYAALLKNAVQLRFRSDVPVGINLSGGLDSSVLLGLVQAVQGPDSDVKAFTFVTGDPAYDELPWVMQMLERTRHPAIVCELGPEDVPELARSVQLHQDEPFGGLPTLAYARLFERARAEGVLVLLDGQGMDEQWAGYDYYRADAGSAGAPIVQGSVDRALRPDCLTPEFQRLAPAFQLPQPFPDRLRNLQFRDARFTKIPRALRFNDRISMRSSTELREPFLDHRLFELAMRQPADRKIHGSVGKWMLREIARDLVPSGVGDAPKRPVQTPQREWLRGPLCGWATQNIEQALSSLGGAWFDSRRVREAWQAFLRGESDNSFYVWQWINTGLMFSGPTQDISTDVSQSRAPQATSL